MNQNIESQFQQLSTLLHQTEGYWRQQAFYDLQLPWMDQHPALTQHLLSLSPTQITILATNISALVDLVAKDIAAIRELTALASLPILPSRPLPEISPHFYTAIPGRKWQQVQAFAATLPDTDGPILEWCAGKSHLGFLLQHCLHRPVTALEWNPELVAQANLRADKHAASLQSHQVDVLDNNVRRFLQPNQQVVALHACGELHEQLLQQAVSSGVKQLHIAPCCYHKRQQEWYTPLSSLGQQSELLVDKKTLQTAVAETSTAGATIQRQRARLQSMRLGFDHLQRDIRGINEFLPIPSLAMSWSKVSFEIFCHHCAALKNITLPKTIDWQHYQRLGEKSFWQVSALDLVRFTFRRPLEVWLVLDKALFLQERGYHVQAGTFCPPSLTPRNLLIQASLHKSMSC